ncbi:MAG: exo-beta-N-acetylmuramidase NamZ domain-containing protein [Bacteroidota bacterium]
MLNKLMPLVFLFVIFACASNDVDSGKQESKDYNDIPIPGAWQTKMYFSLLEGKRIAFFGNHTSTIKETHIVDSLVNAGFHIIKVFSPEHGFRGDAAAGEHISDKKDAKTNLPIISLYGSNKRPNPFHLNDVDLILIDIQDVGTRFYTYISTITYIMEEAAKQNIPVVILDRPNPNGHYIDGPILESDYSSFVGLHPVPIVHGMTIGEYALMLNGMEWLGKNLSCNLTVITIANYNHSTFYKPVIAPSPNLPNIRSIYLYPSLCLFEGTAISVGRGTDFPFQVFGHSELPPSEFGFKFMPQSRKEAPNPPQLDNICYGKDLRNVNLLDLQTNAKINLEYLISAYKNYPDKDNFFNSFFNLLAGNSKLQEQVKAGLSADEIRETWQKDLDNFMEIREKFLLYPDFK